MAENDPFLADNEHLDDTGGEENHLIKTALANSYFVRPLKALIPCITFLSIVAFALLIASYAIGQSVPFYNVGETVDAVRDLAIVLAVNTLVLAATIFFPIPILINILFHIVMSIVVLIFSMSILTRGWPGYSACSRWGPDWSYLPPLPECKKAKTTLKILIGFSAGIGFLTGILLLATLLLHVVALARAKPWNRKKYSTSPGLQRFTWSSWAPNGFTIQLTLKVLKQESANEGDMNKGKAVDTSSESESSQLIET